MKKPFLTLILFVSAISFQTVLAQAPAEASRLQMRSETHQRQAPQDAFQALHLDFEGKLARLQAAISEGETNSIAPIQGDLLQLMQVTVAQADLYTQTLVDQINAAQGDPAALKERLSNWSTRNAQQKKSWETFTVLSQQAERAPASLAVAEQFLSSLKAQAGFFAKAEQ